MNAELQPANLLPHLENRTAPAIDAHHHLWTYNAEEFGWLNDGMKLLQRNFTPEDLGAAMSSAGIVASVAVQARQSVEETRMLLGAAAANAAIAGVVGWLPLAESRALDEALAEFAQHIWLVGARHVVQGEAPGFLDDANFNDGVARLEQADLAYDLLLVAGQLPEAQRFVDRHPHQRFMLDHLGKPRIRDGLMQPWATDLRLLAQRETVSCKLSGMVTEAKWHDWSLDSLRPYLDVAVEAFGPSRLVAGSDWPVCLVASDYEKWWQTLHEYFAPFSATEQTAIFGKNAAHFYRLPVV